MILRTGASGPVVRTVQQFLHDQHLYAGAIDGSYGGGTESAVKNFQKAHQSLPSGVVDAATWAVMFPGQTPPASMLAGQSLVQRCLALTGTFETSHYPPDSYLALSGDFDGMGISFGVCQWNIGQGSLQPLLQQMFTEHEPVVQGIFHEHCDTLRSLSSSTIPEQLAFTRSIQNRGALNEPWRGMLFSLGRTPEFQGIQAKHAGTNYDKAIALCHLYQLRSERAVALMFDIVTQNGSISSIVQAQILADFKSLPATGGDVELEKMRIVANRRAMAAKAQFVDDVRTRKLTIANGTGTVHGLVYDLQDMYGITLQDFQ
jgi:hypothetical protein